MRVSHLQMLILGNIFRAFKTDVQETKNRHVENKPIKFKTASFRTEN